MKNLLFVLFWLVHYTDTEDMFGHVRLECVGMIYINIKGIDQIEFILKPAKRVGTYEPGGQPPAPLLKQCPKFDWLYFLDGFPDTIPVCLFVTCLL